MDPVRNPFAPGAGLRPPELVGRKEVLTTIDVALRRAAIRRPARSQMLLGLRGTGKTVLLKHVSNVARSNPDLTFLSAKIEAPEQGKLAEQLFPVLRSVLTKASAKEATRSTLHAALRSLRSFAGTFKIEYGGVSLSVDPEPGTADSGDLALDLTDVLLSIGRYAQASGDVFSLMIDEVQYLKTNELAALITALHYCGQEEVPVLFIGAGLPQVAGLAGNAKSYAERLFDYHRIGPLPEGEARRALSEPVRAEGERIENSALDMIVADTKGYPYFLQEWGFHAWNIAEGSLITQADARAAREAAIRRLDNGFFKVRMDRLTHKEREYVHAMAALPGDGPYRSGDIAETLGESTQRLGTRRSAIIKKGMIYSPDHGDTAFTVPGFADYLRRVGFMGDGGTKV